MKKHSGNSQQPHVPQESRKSRKPGLSRVPKAPKKPGEKKSKPRVIPPVPPVPTTARSRPRRRLGLPPLWLIVLLILAALYGGLRFKFGSGLGIYRVTKESSSQTLEVRARRLYQLSTVEFVWKTVFPHDFFGPEEEWTRFLINKQYKLPLSPREQEWDELYALCLNTGFSPRRESTEFMVLTVLVKAGYDLAGTPLAGDTSAPAPSVPQPGSSPAAASLEESTSVEEAASSAKAPSTSIELFPANKITLNGVTPSQEAPSVTDEAPLKGATPLKGEPPFGGAAALSSPGTDESPQAFPFLEVTDNVVILSPPRAKILSVILEDPQRETYGFPDARVSPENLQKIARFVISRAASLAETQNLLNRAEENGRSFLQRIFREAGFKEVLFR